MMIWAHLVHLEGGGGGGGGERGGGGGGGGGGGNGMKCNGMTLRVNMRLWGEEKRSGTSARRRRRRGRKGVERVGEERGYW